jgi:hypothetical protein
LSSGGREAPVVTRYLEMKLEVVDNNVRRRKVNARVYKNIAVAIAEVAAVVGRIAVAMR